MCFMVLILLVVISSNLSLSHEFGSHLFYFHVDWFLYDMILAFNIFRLGGCSSWSGMPYPTKYADALFRLIGDEARVQQEVHSRELSRWWLLLQELPEASLHVSQTWLRLTATPSVLKCKASWHFTRFIEHSLNLDKQYVQIHWTFYESVHSKALPGCLTFQDGGRTLYPM